MTKTWFVMAALALGAACGGDDGGGATGVDGSKRVSALTASEITSVCEWMTETLRPRVEECGPPGEEETVAECVAGFQLAASGCAATVAQLEACVQADADADDCDTDAPECEVFEACE